MLEQNERLVEAALDIGSLLLLAGGEVTRVESTISRILAAYGMKKIGVFSITSLIEVTAFTENDEEIVKLRRIRGGYATDLERVEKLNDLSRKICAARPSIETVQAEIAQIRQPKHEAAYVGYIGAAMAAAGFAVFFGGTFADIPATVVLACLINLMEQKGTYKKENQLLFYLLCSFITGSVGCVLIHFGIGVHLDKILIGCVMLTIPGIAITYAVRDMLLGEIITGMLRFTESILIATSIAGGFLLSNVIIGEFLL